MYLLNTPTCVKRMSYERILKIQLPPLITNLPPNPLTTTLALKKSKTLQFKILSYKGPKANVNMCFSDFEVLLKRNKNRVENPHVKKEEKNPLKKKS